MTEACFSVVWGEQSTVFALFSDTPYHILDSGSRVVKTRPHRLLVLLLERFTTLLSYVLLPFTDFAVYTLQTTKEDGVFRYANLGHLFLFIPCKHGSGRTSDVRSVAKRRPPKQLDGRTRLLLPHGVKNDFVRYGNLEYPFYSDSDRCSESLH